MTLGAHKIQRLTLKSAFNCSHENFTWHSQQGMSGCGIKAAWSFLFFSSFSPNKQNTEH
jgi:hypothetical protein